MSGPVEVMCSRCDGTGKVETVWRTIYSGWMECQARCLACAGTGWVPIDTIPGWARAQAEAIRADQLRRHEAGLAADLAYRAGAQARKTKGGLMSNPVHRIAMELAAEVELSRVLMDIDTDDPMLDEAFRREVERAAALSRALLCGEGPS